MSTPERIQNTRTYTATITLGAAAAGVSLGPLQTTLAPGRDQSWDITRVWAYTFGYEAILRQGLGAPFTSADPYAVEAGTFGGATSVPPIYYSPMAMIYRNSISLEKLLQPFTSIPRTFEPISLSQIAHIAPNEQVVLLAAELVPIAGDAVGGRAGRGVSFGIDVIETSDLSP